MPENSTTPACAFELQALNVRPRTGDVVFDAATQKVGRVMDQMCRLVQLRPLEGGREWDASPDDLTPAALTPPPTAGAR